VGTDGLKKLRGERKKKSIIAQQRRRGNRSPSPYVGQGDGLSKPDGENHERSSCGIAKILKYKETGEKRGWGFPAGDALLSKIFSRKNVQELSVSRLRGKDRCPGAEEGLPRRESSGLLGKKGDVKKSKRLRGEALDGYEPPIKSRD